jgi:hypothetical protein
VGRLLQTTWSLKHRVSEELKRILGADNNNSFARKTEFLARQLSDQVVEIMGRWDIYRSSRVILMPVLGHAVLTPREQSRAG